MTRSAIRVPSSLPSPAGVTPLDAVKLYTEEMERDENMALRAAAQLRKQLQEAEARAEANRAATSEELLTALFRGRRRPMPRRTSDAVQGSAYDAAQRPERCR